MNAQSRLKEIREDLGLSQQKLADDLEIKINPISGIESGKQKEFSLPLAYALHTKYDYEPKGRGFESLRAHLLIKALGFYQSLFIILSPLFPHLFYLIAL